MVVVVSIFGRVERGFMYIYEISQLAYIPRPPAATAVRSGGKLEARSAAVGPTLD